MDHLSIKHFSKQHITAIITVIRLIFLIYSPRKLRRSGGKASSIWHNKSRKDQPESIQLRPDSPNERNAKRNFVLPLFCTIFAADIS